MSSWACVVRHSRLDLNVLNVEVLEQLLELIFALKVFLELAVVRRSFYGSLPSLREHIVWGISVFPFGIRWSLDVVNGRERRRVLSVVLDLVLSRQGNFTLT